MNIYFLLSTVIMSCDENILKTDKINFNKIYLYLILKESNTQRMTR